VLCEAAAVEPVRIAAAVAIRRAAERQRGADERVRITANSTAPKFRRCNRVGGATSRRREWFWHSAGRRAGRGHERQRDEGQFHVTSYRHERYGTTAPPNVHVFIEFPPASS